MPKWLTFDTDYCCRKHDDPPTGPPVPGEGIPLSASVGVGGKNNDPDVRTIQDALNRVPIDQGRAAPLLKVDGICGAKTRNAIGAFQVKQFGWSHADGKVDPFARTHLKLSELVGKPFRKPDQVMVDGMLKHLTLAMNYIAAAKVNLLGAVASVDQKDDPGPISVFGRESRMRLSNRHFRIDDYSPFERKAKLEHAMWVFDRMSMVFQRPGGLWGPMSFAPDQTQDRSYAYTFMGGFDRGGTIQKGVRLDTIYFCTKSFAVLDFPDMAAHIIVHELSHFVGGKTAGIDDFAYGSAESDNEKRLNHYQKLHNADCYANFAREAFFGIRPKPSWQRR
jgi:Putative peptidoglycan binding domain/Lysine-specific metallo-endopeptidase